MKTYKVITAKKEKEIEDTINELVADGWEVEKFSYAFKWKRGESRYWALMVKERTRASKKLSPEVAKLTKLSEDKLYEMIGEALFAQELLKKPTKLLKSEGIKRILSKTRKADSRKKGKIFVDKMRERMFKKICVEAQACKWEKHVLKDNKGLIETLVPLIGSIIGLAIPAITIAVAIIVTKRGIKEFCKCPPA